MLISSDQLRKTLLSNLDIQEYCKTFMLAELTNTFITLLS